MADVAVFERRLREALERYVAGAPAEFDALAFAHAVARAEPRRRTWPLRLGWWASGSHRLAWIVLAAAAVLIAAVGAIAGSDLLRRDEVRLPPLPSSSADAKPAPSELPALPPPQNPVQIELDGAIVDLAFGDDGTIWAATGHGLVHWDPAARTGVLYGMDNGLPKGDVANVGRPARQGRRVGFG